MPKYQLVFFTSLMFSLPATLLFSSGVVFSNPLDHTDPNAIHMNHSEALVRAFESTPHNGGSRCDSGRILPCHSGHDGHSDVYGRIDPSKPGPTMTTACVNPSKGRFVHPTENHGITARHAARMQGFPDQFVFEGGLMAAGVQIGNAVPIGLGMATLGAVAHFIDAKTSKRRVISCNRKVRRLAA